MRFVSFFLEATQKASVQLQVQCRAAGAAHFRRDPCTFTMPDRSSCTPGVALTSCHCPQTPPSQPQPQGEFLLSPPTPALELALQCLCAGCQTTPSPPRTPWCHQHSSPTNHSGCCRNCVKDTESCNQVRETGCFPSSPHCERRGLPVLAAQAWPHFPQPCFLEGVED